MIPIWDHWSRLKFASFTSKTPPPQHSQPFHQKRALWLKCQLIWILLPAVASPWHGLHPLARQVSPPSVLNPLVLFLVFPFSSSVPLLGKMHSCNWWSIASKNFSHCIYPNNSLVYFLSRNQSSWFVGFFATDLALLGFGKDASQSLLSNPNMHSLHFPYMPKLSHHSSTVVMANCKFGATTEGGLG